MNTGPYRRTPPEGARTPRGSPHGLPCAGYRSRCEAFLPLRVFPIFPLYSTPKPARARQQGWQPLLIAPGSGKPRRRIITRPIDGLTRRPRKERTKRRRARRVQNTEGSQRQTGIAQNEALEPFRTRITNRGTIHPSISFIVYFQEITANADLPPA